MLKSEILVLTANNNTTTKILLLNTAFLKEGNGAPFGAKKVHLGGEKLKGGKRETIAHSRKIIIIVIF